MHDDLDAILRGDGLPPSNPFLGIRLTSAGLRALVTKGVWQDWASMAALFGFLGLMIWLCESAADPALREDTHRWIRGHHYHRDGTYHP